MCCWYAVGDEFARDLGEAAAGGVLGSDSVDDVGGERGWASRPRRRTCLRSCLSPALGNEALDLVDGNKMRPPPRLDRLDEWEDAPDEGRAADPERLGSLGSGVGETAWRRAELVPIGLHECRHTFASLVIAAGVNAKAITAYLGHASIQTTFDLYGHLMPGNEDEAVALVDAYLERAGTGNRLAQLNR